ncbi:MAG TPA: LPS export ABC transporter periplasmic protein LptC [Steroidobacteraceae bacterium]
MIYRIFIVVVFIAIIAGAVFLGSEQREPVASTTVDERAADPGYVVRQARLVETGADGHPLYTIDADLIRQPPGSTDVNLEQVKMGFRDTAGNRWNGQADSAVLGRDTDQVELAGNVRIWGFLPGEPDQASIETEKLSVDMKTETAATKDPVTLNWSGNQAHARGMSANLKERTVHLRSRVHAISSR